MLLKLVVDFKGEEQPTDFPVLLSLESPLQRNESIPALAHAGRRSPFDLDEVDRKKIN